jgi:2-amino-4-hydroxy-6-hydroxymethyldihydropteridine diphosphokinase
VLDALRAIEKSFGRERPYVGAPRTLDLDLILYGGDVIEMPDLIVPHPRFRDRRFVLEPLAELAPEWIDPVTGKTIGELLRVAQKRGGSEGRV